MHNDSRKILTRNKPRHKFHFRILNRVCLSSLHHILSLLSSIFFPFLFIITASAEWSERCHLIKIIEMNYERDEILWNGKKTHFNSTSTSFAKIDHADLQSNFFTSPILIHWVEIYFFTLIVDNSIRSSSSCRKKLCSISCSCAVLLSKKKRSSGKINEKILKLWWFLSF